MDNLIIYYNIFRNNQVFEFNFFMENKYKKLFHFFLLILIVAAAFFLRFYKIDSIPAGVYPDETVNATDAINANETGEYKIFYTNNYGREGLFMNLVALSFKIFGVNILALKIWSIVFGTLTVLGIFLLAKELFKSNRAGLISAFLSAFSFWAINFSRISFRAIMLPFVLTFTFYFIFKGIRSGKFYPFALAGLFFGIGMHTYIAFRVAPAVLFALFIVLLISKRRVFQGYWKHALVFFAFFLITASPMIYDFVKYPEHFSSRSNSISVLSPEVNKGNLWGTLGKSFGLSIAKYNFWGDQNWRHNYPPYPILDPITGIAFLAGIVYIIYKTLELLILRVRHGILDEKLYIFAFILAWFFALLAPEFLTAEGNPHALRSIGTIPVVHIIAAIPFLWVLGKSEKFGYLTKVSVWSLIFLCFIIIASFNTAKYFVFFANRPEQHGQFNENFKNMAIYLNSLPDDVHKYVLPNAGGKTMEDGLPVSAQPIKFLTYRKAKNLEFLNENSIIKRPMVIVFMRYDQGMIDNVKNFYPQAEVKKIDLSPGFPSDFITIEIK